MKKDIESLEKQTYIAPDIEIIEIKIEQNILQSGSTNDLNSMAGEAW